MSRIKRNSDRAGLARRPNRLLPHRGVERAFERAGWPVESVSRHCPEAVTAPEARPASVFACCSTISCAPLCAEKRTQPGPRSEAYAMTISARKIGKRTGGTSQAFQFFTVHLALAGARFSLGHRDLANRAMVGRRSGLSTAAVQCAIRAISPQ